MSEKMAYLVAISGRSSDHRALLEVGCYLAESAGDASRTAEDEFAEKFSGGIWKITTTVPGFGLIIQDENAPLRIGQQKRSRP